MSEADGRADREGLPLNSIRVFTEAARQGSFSGAARALKMTQGAVSQHVAALERFLGKALFTRAASLVTLNDAGRAYFDAVHEAVSTIEVATRQMTQRSGPGERLVVRTSLPTFASVVLIPLLPKFDGLPAASVDVLTSLAAPDAGERYDVLISRDLAIAGAQQWHLAREELICVGSPGLREAWGRQPMTNWPFIVASSRPDALAGWVAGQVPVGGPPRIVGVFAHYFLALPAAVAGVGLMVVPRQLVGELLRHGHLVEMPGARIGLQASYDAYVNPASPNPEAARRFCRWLKRQLTEDAMP